MPFAQISQIKTSDRQRSSMDYRQLDELKASILERGLLHPIVIDRDFNLIAGGRRLRAITELQAEGHALRFMSQAFLPGEIPCSMFMEELTDVSRKEIELEENLIREDLSWQDRVRALAEIHTLRLANNPDQTFMATGKEIVQKTGSTRSATAVSAEISRALVTSQLLDDPDIKSASNEQYAFNAATRKIRNDFAKTLASRTTDTAGPHRLYTGNARDILPTMQQRFRCFILDPPYGIQANKFGNAADGRHSYDDSQSAAAELNAELIAECSKLATDDAHMWLFCDIDLLSELKEILHFHNWKPFRTPIVWNSGTSGHVPNQKTAIRRNYELVLFASRSDRGLAQLLDDVIRINSKSTDFHGAQKPAELYELLIKLSCNPGDAVLDPTCGSGTIFRACDATGTIGHGIELDPSFAEECRGVIAELEEKKA